MQMSELWEIWLDFIKSISKNYIWNDWTSSSSVWMTHVIHKRSVGEMYKYIHIFNYIFGCTLAHFLHWIHFPSKFSLNQLPLSSTQTRIVLVYNSIWHNRVLNWAHTFYAIESINGIIQNRCELFERVSNEKPTGKLNEWRNTDTTTKHRSRLWNLNWRNV